MWNSWYKHRTDGVFDCPVPWWRITTAVGWCTGSVLVWVLLGASTQVLAQAVPGADYQVRVSDYYGQLKTSGYSPLKFTITRFNAAVNVAETLYAGIEVSSSLDGGKTETLTQVDFVAGQTTTTLEINLPKKNGFESLAVVSRDGSLDARPRPELIASIALPNWYSKGPTIVNTGRSVTENFAIAYFSSQPVMDTGVHLDSFWNDSWTAQQQLVSGQSFDPNASGFPNFRTLSSVTWDESLRTFWGHRSFVLPVNRNMSTAYRSRFVVVGDFSAIPSTWLGLSPVDICFMSVDDLKLLADQQPDKIEVLRQWVHAGGRLLVFNCKRGYSGLGSIIPNLNSGASPAIQVAEQQWMMFHEKNSDFLYSYYRRSAVAWRQKISQQNAEPQTDDKFHSSPIVNSFCGLQPETAFRTFSGTVAKIAEDASAAYATVLINNYGVGRILAVPNDAATIEIEQWVIILYGGFGCHMSTCYDGIGDRNHDFVGYEEFEYNKLGKPPWVLFLVMITTFAIFVGPVAFVLLMRLERPHLLLVAVPAIATLMTTGIVGSSLIRDGFHVRTARLSATWLDSNHQTALTQTTQMAYSGSAPGNLEFSRETAYYDDSSRGRPKNGQMRLFTSGDRQSVSASHIQARTKFQVTTFDVQHHTGKVLLSASPDGSKWKATNQLGFPVDLLVVQTPVGTLSAVDIPDGGDASLEPGLAGQWQSEFSVRGLATQSAIFEWGRASAGVDRKDDRMLKTKKSLAITLSSTNGEYKAISSQQPLARKIRDYTYQDEELHITAGQCILTSSLLGPPSGTTSPPAQSNPSESGQSNADSSLGIESPFDQVEGAQLP